MQLTNKNKKVVCENTKRKHILYFVLIAPKNFIVN